VTVHEELLLLVATAAIQETTLAAKRISIGAIESSQKR
jgi:hypothetical protein